MEDIIIEGKKEYPRVHFRADGKLEISGKSYPEYAVQFYEPILKFINQLTVKSVQFKINLDYLNTSSSKCLQNLIESLDKNPFIENIDIKWYTELDDEENLDLGKMFEENVARCKFEYFEIQGAS